MPASGGVRVALIAGLAAARRARRRQPRRRPRRRRGRASSCSAARRASSSSSRTTTCRSSTSSTSSTTRARRSTSAEPLVVELPEGATAPARWKVRRRWPRQGDRIRITGPFPPGTTLVQVGFRLPYSGDRATLTQQWPAAMEQCSWRRRRSATCRWRRRSSRSSRKPQAGGAPVRHGDRRPAERRRHADAQADRAAAPQHAVRDVGVGCRACSCSPSDCGRHSRARPRAPSRRASLAERREKLFAELVAARRAAARAAGSTRRATRRAGSAGARSSSASCGELDRAPGRGGGREGVAA